jgi:hypothetical protein
VAVLVAAVTAEGAAAKGSASQAGIDDNYSDDAIEFAVEDGADAEDEAAEDGNAGKISGDAGDSGGGGGSNDDDEDDGDDEFIQGGGGSSSSCGWFVRKYRWLMQRGPGRGMFAWRGTRLGFISTWLIGGVVGAVQVQPVDPPVA